MLLRTYCNLELAEGGLTDEMLAHAPDIESLEKLVDDFVEEKPAKRGAFKKCCRCPRHIREQWRKSKRQWERMAGSAPKVRRRDT